jgi:hypothetical protein
VLIHGRASRLDDKYIAAAHIIVYLDARFAVLEFASKGAAQVHIQASSDFLRERSVCIPAKNQEPSIHYCFTPPLKLLRASACPGVRQLKKQ